MAVIGSIRKHSTFLVIIIGVALAAFVLGDFTKRRTGRTTDVGAVDGEEISIIDFNQRVEQNIEGTKQQQNKQNLTQDEIFRIKDETWKQMVRQALMQKEYEELGLEVTSEELFDLVQGPNPHPLIQQYFVNPNTGQYDRNVVINFLQNLDKMAAEAKQQWIQLEDYIKNDQLKKKYDALVSKGYYVPKQLAYTNFSEENDAASISFVCAKYSDVSDSAVKVTEEDYKKYYEKNKALYDAKAMIDIEYVSFDVKPSEKDLAEAEKDIYSVFEGLRTTDNIARYVTTNSDGLYDSSWKTQAQLPARIDSIMFNSPVGMVVKPYLDDNVFYTARLVAEANRPDSLKASHILISYAGALRANPNVTRNKLQAQSLADSLLLIAIKSPKTFADLATEYSSDPSAATNKGDLGWFADGTMVYAFNEAVVNGKVGDIVMEETPFGYHIIEITGKKPEVKKVKVAIISRVVIASTETYQQTFAGASKIATECKTKEQFDKAVETDKLNKRKADKLQAMSDYIPGLTNARQVIRWGFSEETEINQVSEVFDLENTFVVAVLINRTKDGIPPLDASIKTRINSMVTNEVKGEYLKKEMESLNNNPDQVINRLKGVRGEMNPLMFSSRNLQGYGTENEVIGTVFGMKLNQQAGPIIGKAGVFLVQLNSLTKIPTQSDYTQVISTMQTAFKNRVDQDNPYKAIEKISKIDDNRMMFY